MISSDSKSAIRRCVAVAEIRVVVFGIAVSELDTARRARTLGSANKTITANAISDKPTRVIFNFWFALRDISTSINWWAICDVVSPLDEVLSYAALARSAC